MVFLSPPGAGRDQGEGHLPLRQDGDAQRPTFEFKRIPCGGITAGFPLGPKWVRTRYFLFVLAGPLSNFALAAGAYLLVPEDSKTFNFERRLNPALVWINPASGITTASQVIENPFRNFSWKVRRWITASPDTSAWKRCAGSR